MFKDIVHDKFMSNENNLSSPHWSLEDGYTEGCDDNKLKDIFVYPYRALNAGSKAGLKVNMAIRETDMDYMCRGPVQGFKVILHTPNELPQVEGQYFRIPTGQDMRVSIKPNILKTKLSLIDYPPSRLSHLVAIIIEVHETYFHQVFTKCYQVSLRITKNSAKFR